MLLCLQFLIHQVSGGNNCVWAPVTATDCTPSCGIIISQTKTITEANGGTCTAAPTYSCQPGDGSCWADNDSEV